ncbi:MAG: hypothetical protein KGL39_24000 [Patescibacteria group bacterium]|nr:hypothetical protein [Patescibacteria group bacterium]
MADEKKACDVPHAAAIFHIYPLTAEAKAQYPETRGSSNDAAPPCGARIATNTKGDAGVDLRFPKRIDIAPGKTVDVDLEVRAWCDVQGASVPYFLVPRSSIGKTPLLAGEDFGPVVGAADAAVISPIAIKFCPTEITPASVKTLVVTLTNTGKVPYVISPGVALFQLVEVNLRPATYRRVDAWNPPAAQSPGNTGKFTALLCSPDEKAMRLAETTMLPLPQDVTIEPKAVADVRLGVRAAFLRDGETPWACWLVPLLNDTPLVMKNWAGVVDAGYRGELIAKIYNTSATKYKLSKGVTAFGVMNPFGTLTAAYHVPGTHPQFTDGATERGAGAFGSTGESGQK